MTSTQQNQKGIGTASELENLTADNTGLLQNASDIGSQNTSMTEGLQQEQTTTDTNMTNQTGAMANEKSANVQKVPAVIVVWSNTSRSISRYGGWE